MNLKDFNSFKINNIFIRINKLSFTQFDRNNNKYLTNTIIKENLFLPMIQYILEQEILPFLHFDHIQ